MTKNTCWVEGCTEERVKWGMCAPHRERWLYFFPRRETKIFGASPKERFAAYVVKDVDPLVRAEFSMREDCWIWSGSLEASGYGIIGIDGTSTRTHLFSLEMSGRKLLPSRTRDHLCRIRPCCNPAHLEQVTAQANVLRGEGVASANVKKEFCPQGHRLEGENLLTEKVGDGRERRRCRTCRNLNAADRYAVSREGKADRRRSDEACRNGHPRTEETTVIRGGKRRCRICLADASRASYGRKTDEQKAKRREEATLVTGVRGSGQFRKTLTHCPQGHPYSGDNLIEVRRKVSDGSERTARRCRACQARANAVSYEKRRDREK